jgi:hypothetical protein
MLDDTERHPLESEALAHGTGAGAAAVARYATARRPARTGPARTRSPAAWSRIASAMPAAQLAADEAGEPLLAIRALIAESRA